MQETDRAVRFLAAFNEIEEHIRSELGADHRKEFVQLAREYADRRRLPRNQRDALGAFASLRNAIAHGRYFEGKPIAEPVREVVEQIERLRDQIKRPPLALAVLGQTTVSAVRPNDPISRALEYVRTRDYSQLPVYDDAGYQGLVTTNAIARWLAAQLAEMHGLAEDAPIRDVQPFCEPHEVALHVPRSITATEAIDRLLHGRAGLPVVALIVTETGNPRSIPLAVIVTDDIPALSGVLAV